MNFLKLTEFVSGHPIYVDRCEIIIVESKTKYVREGTYEPVEVVAGSRLILEHNESVTVRELPEAVAALLNYEAL